jgi:hypothetical protein
MVLLTMGLNLYGFFRSSLSKPGINFKMIKSAFQIPHHVAIRIFQCVAPRRFSAEKIDASGDGFPHSEETYYKKLRGFPHSCAKVAPYSRFVWANSVKVIPPLLILDGTILSSRGSGHIHGGDPLPFWKLNV